jgi:hypothetical protein
MSHKQSGIRLFPEPWTTRYRRLVPWIVVLSWVAFAAFNLWQILGRSYE